MADLTNVALTVDINFTAHVNGDKNAELKHYQATVVFSSIDALLERGGESVKRILQTQARSEDGFPTGFRVTVDEKGKREESKEEKLQKAMANIAKLDPNDADDEAQLEAMFKIYQEKKAAKLAAEKAAFDAAKKTK